MKMYFCLFVFSHFRAFVIRSLFLFRFARVRVLLKKNPSLGYLHHMRDRCLFGVEVQVYPVENNCINGFVKEFA